MDRGRGMLDCKFLWKLSASLLALEALISVEFFFCFCFCFKTNVLQSWLFIRFLGKALCTVTLLDTCLCPKFFIKILYSHEQLLPPSLPGPPAGVLLKIGSEGLFHHLWSLCLENSSMLHQKQFLFLWRLMIKKKKKKDTWAEMKIGAFVCSTGFLDWTYNLLSPLRFAQKVV